MSIKSEVSSGQRFFVLIYGVVSYLLGVSALLGIIFSTLGLMDFSYNLFEFKTPWLGVLNNVILMSLFGVQHSIMARPWFKKKWTAVIPVSAERSTFVLATAFVTWALLLLWQGNSSLIWETNDPKFVFALRGLCLLGWVYLLLASFCINHFELFGLEQVYYYFTGRECPTLPFKEHFMYRFDRHPIMTGALIGLWATPKMTTGNFQFSLLFTIYVIIGVSYEERDLIRQWGEDYKSYAKRVHTIVPRFF